jgi:hypothetical protein
MPLIKVYNNDSDPYGLKGHSIFKSVRPFSFGYAVVPKLCKQCLHHHVQAASAKAVSFRRTFGDEAWSQHLFSLHPSISEIVEMECISIVWITMCLLMSKFIIMHKLPLFC